MVLLQSPLVGDDDFGSSAVVAAGGDDDDDEKNECMREISGDGDGDGGTTKGCEGIDEERNNDGYTNRG